MSEASFLTSIKKSTESRNDEKKKIVPLKNLKSSVECLPMSSLRLHEVFKNQAGPKIIAEIKRKSPSQGSLHTCSDPIALAHAYGEAGATAISILTEPTSFGGNLEDLRTVKKTYPDLVVLQKDFVIDPYQIYEAKLLGADAVLLIVALLGEKKTREFQTLAQSLGLSCLVEVHTLVELKIAVASGASIIGINNRDLHTLKISLDTSRELRSYIPKGVVTISESGLTSAQEILELQALGFDGFLIGSSFMRHSSPAEGLKKLIKEIR